MRRLLTLILLLAAVCGGACPGPISDLAPREPRLVKLYKDRRPSFHFNRRVASLREGDTVEFGNGSQFVLGAHLYGDIYDDYGVAFALEKSTLWIAGLKNAPGTRGEADEMKRLRIRVHNTGEDFIKMNAILVTEKIPTVELQYIGEYNQFLLLARVPAGMIPVRDLFTPGAKSMEDISPEMQTRMRNELVAFAGAMYRFERFGFSDMARGLFFHPSTGWLLRDYAGTVTRFRRREPSGYGLTPFTIFFEDLEYLPETVETFDRMRDAIRRRREAETGETCLVDLGLPEKEPTSAEMAQSEAQWDALEDAYHPRLVSFEAQFQASHRVFQARGTTSRYHVRARQIDGGRFYHAYRLDRDWQIRIPDGNVGADRGRTFKAQSEAILATQKKLETIGVPIIETVASLDGKDYFLAEQVPKGAVDLERFLFKEDLERSPAEIREMEEALVDFARKSALLEDTLDLRPDEIVYFPGQGWKLTNWIDWYREFTPKKPARPGGLLLENSGYSLFNARLQRMLTGRSETSTLYVNEIFARLRREVQKARETLFVFPCPVVTGEHKYRGASGDID